MLSLHPYESRLVEQCQKLLDIYNTISFGFTYPNEETMLAARPAIERDKKKFNDRLNFLRPDIHKNGCVISYQKIFDNAICDSIRVKFSVNKVHNYVDKDILKYIVPFFIEASNIYKKYSLFHRSPSDGYFAIRVGNSFAITATKTDKIDLDIERICLVHKYEESTNTIEYSGKFLPSSDSVEVAIVFQLLSKINSVIHSHASEKFTRNKSWSDWIKVPSLPYGEAELGYSLTKALKNSKDGFVIMEEHGEVFAGFEPQWNSTIELVERCVSNSLQNLI